METATVKMIIDLRAMIAKNRAAGRKGHEGIPKEQLAAAVQALREGRVNAAPAAKGAKAAASAEATAKSDELLNALRASVAQRQAAPADPQK